MHIILILIIFKIKSAKILENLSNKYNEEEIDFLKLQNLQTISKKNVDFDKKQIDWQEFLVKDEYNIEEVFDEMFFHYNCNNVISNNENINNVDELFINIKLDYLNKNMKTLYSEDVTNYEKYNNKKLININNQDVTDVHLECDFIFNNIEQLSKCYYFINLFDIIENDLKNIIYNSIKYLYCDNEYLKNAKLDLEKNCGLIHKIKRFFKLLNDILNTDLKHIERINSKLTFDFNKILSTKYRKKEYYKNLNNKIQSKYYLLNKYLEENNLTNYEIFNFTKYIVKMTKDLFVRKSIILGLQNLFLNDYHDSRPRFIKLLLILYTFNNEKNFFKIDWYDYIYRIISLYKFNSKVDINEYIQKAINNNVNKIHRLYIFLNSYSIEYAFNNYIICEQDEIVLKSINCLIDLLTKVKCKIFGLNFD